MSDLLGSNWNEQGVAETANRLDLPLTDAYAAAMENMDDLARMDKLGISIRPYNAQVSGPLKVIRNKSLDCSAENRTMPR